ncbi:MAG: hypothetical protein J5529_04235 [Prevotella sp.]|nr:hypothetical protein [Prevotella sp.]
MKKILFTLTLMLVALTAKAQSCPDDNHPHAIDLGSDIAGTEYDVAHVKWGSS